MEEIKILTTLEEVKAMSDPFKYRILMSFYKREQPSTVKQIADAINEVPANVHYHVKKMEKAGILKLVYTKEINSIIARYYEPTAKAFDIRCDSEIAGSNKNIMLAQSQQMVAGVYDDSKNTFIEQLTYSAQTEEKTNGNVSVEDLYLTDEEAEELNIQIKDILKKYNNKDRNVADVNKYHCLLSLFKILNEK
jgi:DNA-binding MarR family transcriptional regulator